MAGTASQLIFQREAAHSKPNFAQPIILAYGTCALAKISRDSAGAWLYAQLAKNLPTSTIALDPYEFRSLQGVLIKRRKLIYPNNLRLIGAKEGKVGQLSLIHI